MRPCTLVAAALAAAGLLAAVPAAHAAFVPPSGWSIGDPRSTYQEWEVFTAPAGPNAPNGAGDAAADPFNPNGVADAFDRSGPGVSFVTSGGNIYSPTGQVQPQVDLPNDADADATFTTIILNLRTLGTAPDLDSFVLSADGESYSPEDAVLTGAIALGGFGGDLLDHWFQWVVPGNAANYTITFEALESSLSLDRIRVDTIYTAAAEAIVEAAPPAVPEPGSIALMSLGLAALTLGRRGA